MGSDHHRSFPVADRSYVSIVKKDIHQMAADAGFSPVQLGQIDIIIAEICSNFIKHAGGGELLVRAGKDHGIDIIGIDNGPGMADVGKMMEDGTSTTNTLGGGLGAIWRLSDRCQIYSRKDWGTIVYAALWHRKPRMMPAAALQHYHLSVPYPGEQVCGDGFACISKGSQVRLFLGDGLGHGKEADLAVQAAIKALESSPSLSPSAMLRDIHTAVKKTRGLVGALAIFQPARRMWQFCGVGNISMRFIGGLLHKSHMSYNGIIGHSIPRTLNDQSIETMRGQYLIMCSDGIRTRWDVTRYPHIFRYDPCILAAAIYKDHTRRTDDASVVVIRVT